MITRKGKIILTEETFLRILEWYHTNLCHPGQNRTFSTLNSTYYFPNIEARVREYIDDCQVCKKNKVHSQKYGELPLSEMQADPWEIIQIDLFGPWTFIDKDGIDRKICGLTIIDVATRWPELRAYSSKRSEDISMIIDQEWFSRYPRPRVAIFDNGSEFSSELRELLASYGVKPKPTTIKNP